jgi:hypothetical protein
VKVLNVFTDDGAVFDAALKSRFGRMAKEEDVTDSTDLVGFFPSLSSDLISAALRRELRGAVMAESDALRNRPTDRSIENAAAVLRRRKTLYRR